MKKINLDALSAKYNISEYKALYAKIIALIQDNKIKPVKSSGTNGRQPRRRTACVARRTFPDVV